MNNKTRGKNTKAIMEVEMNTNNYKRLHTLASTTTTTTKMEY